MTRIEAANRNTVARQTIRVMAETALQFLDEIDAVVADVEKEQTS